jgi:hypothetical protein
MQVLDPQGFFHAESLSKLYRGESECALRRKHPKLRTKLSTVAVDCEGAKPKPGVALIAQGIGQ